MEPGAAAEDAKSDDEDSVRGTPRAVPAAYDGLLEIEEVQGAFRTFRDFDADGSGEIDGTELRGLLKAMNIEVSESEVRLLLKEVDVNGDGVLDFDEFLGVRGSSPARARPARPPLTRGPATDDRPRQVGRPGAGRLHGPHPLAAHHPHPHAGQGGPAAEAGGAAAHPRTRARALTRASANARSVRA